MNLKRLIISATLSLFFTSAVHAEEKPKTPEKKNVTIVVGTRHYTPQRTMPALQTELERLGFDVTLISPDWDPEKDERGLPGLEALKDADVAVFFTRFLTINDEQLNHMMDYVKSGKPVVGLRTTGHGFNYPKTSPHAELNIGFGRDVFGSPYLIHLAGSTELNVIESEKNHPILTGITGPWTSSGTLYLTRLEEGVVPLVTGTGHPKGGKAHTRTNQFGTHRLEETMTDTVAWTWSNKYAGKTFFTSLGHIRDFTDPKSVRLIVNGIHWAAGLPVPSADTEIKGLKIPPGKKK